MSESLHHAQTKAAEAPLLFHTARLAACQQDTSRLDAKHRGISLLRLACAAAVLAAGWYSLGRHLFAWEWVFVPCAAFAITARWHGSVLAAAETAWRATRFNEHALARLGDRWQGVRPRDARVDASGSLYAQDLDLFGPASVFELLCTARTTAGEDTLASWLLQPATADNVRARQAAVAELKSGTALREFFASTPGKELLTLDAGSFANWGESTQPALGRPLRWIALAMPILVILVIWQCVLAHSFLLLLPIVLVNIGLTFAQEDRLKRLFAQTQEDHRRYDSVSALFACIERESFTSPYLLVLQVRVGQGGRAASYAMKRLTTLATFVEQRLNWFTRLLDMTFLFSIQLGFFVERWRQIYGRQLRPWFDALGEFEALLSFAAYSFEHPDDPFPELVPELVDDDLQSPAFSNPKADDVAGSSLFVAEALGHPLLPQASAVRNSFELDPHTRLLLISGSNMSGKSTLLRSAGVAAVLAMAGAPVRARRLRLSPLRVAASMQINDSIQSGRSHFYAEILRLGAVCTLAREHPPVLFLLDELLAGTNSHDRAAGASGIVKALLAAGAFGMLSTHDLALTSIPGPEMELIHNAHFEDSVINGALHFDYMLREGVVTRSNGLALMRMIGLDV